MCLNRNVSEHNIVLSIEAKTKFSTRFIIHTFILFIYSLLIDKERKLSKIKSKREYLIETCVIFIYDAVVILQVSNPFNTLSKSQTEMIKESKNRHHEKIEN